MNILLINIVLLLLVFAPYLAIAQEGDFDDPQQFQQDQHQQQHQVTLTRDAIERLLQLLSQNCRQEMESALAVRGDISDHCKGEIQEVLKGFPAEDFAAVPPEGLQNAYENAGDNDFDNNEQQLPEGGRRRRAAATASNSIVSPAVAIIAFVVVLLGAATGYVIYFNKVAAPVLNASAKPKKLSKKKVRIS